MATTSRILALLSLLQTRRHWRGPELAERMGVTERTLRRDIERLRGLDYRVEATRGSAGGYRLEAGLELPPLLLTEEEAVTIAIGLRVAATQGLVDGETTTVSALAKFEQLLPNGMRQRVNALASTVRASTPHSVPVSPSLLSELALACRDRERIRFHYVDGRGVESDRVVEPHSVVSAQQNWFFVCWDLHRGHWRTFRVDRMSRFFGTRVRCAARDLPAADAADFVAAAVSSLRAAHTASVVMDLPLEQMVEHFGPWADGATSVDARHTRWPIGGRSHEEMLAALVWIPAGVAYRIEGDAAFACFAREATERLLAATGNVTPDVGR